MASLMNRNKLKFHQSILSTLESPIAIEELLKRLTSLHEELSTTVQDTIDLQTLDKYCQDLCHKKLLRHKNNGIKALVSCCLCDILRLYAPNAPYTDVQLNDIFKLFLQQFENLSDPDNGYLIQQIYLINKLLEYRSIVLITDLPNSAKLLEELFQIFYDDNKSFPTKLYKVIGGILGEVISEFDSVPLKILKLIFNKFLTFNPKEIPKGLGVASNCGYELTLILCDVYSSRISRQLTKYYSEVLYDVTKNQEINPDTEHENYNLIKTVEKLHKLVRRLWETDPELVSAVIGFVHHELSSPIELIRKSATKLIGDLVSDDSKNNFISTNKDTFNVWISKVADVGTSVRVQWVECLPSILLSRNDSSKDINQALTKALIDSDPAVRKSSVSIFDKTDIKNIWNGITNPSAYSSLVFLTREKNKEVRELCIKTTGKFYSESVENIERNSSNKEIWDVIDTIPSTFFNLYYINDLNINEQADQNIFRYILPLETNDEKRVSRLLKVLANFDKKAFSSFFAFNKRQLQMSTALNKYIEFSELLNGNSTPNDSNEIKNSDIRIKYNKTIEWLTFTLSDKTKAMESLTTLTTINDRKIFNLIKTCIRNDVDLVTLKNSFEEVLTKLGDPGLFRKYDIPTVSTIIPKNLANQLQILLYRAAPLIYNSSNINIFLDYSDTNNPIEKDLKRKILDDISVVNPTAFKDQLKKLKNDVLQYNENEKDKNKVTSFLDTIRTLYKLVKALKDEIDFEDEIFLSKLKILCLNTNCLIAKYSVKLICLSSEAEYLLNDIKDTILPLDFKKSNQVTTNVVVLMEIFRFHPNTLDENSTEIVSYLIKEVLLTNRITTDKESINNNWVDDEILLRSEKEEHKSLVTKIFTLKLLTNKLRAVAFNLANDELAKVFTEKTVSLFFYLISAGGEIVPETDVDNYPTPESYQTKLRYFAGLQLLKLAKISNINDFINTADVIKLVNLVEDESLEVRKLFLEKLKDYISNELISIKFLPLIFFTAYEPDVELKKTMKIWINYTASKESFRRGTFFERVLPRLIHAISHHPDIIEGLDGNETEYLNALRSAIDYLIFYFDSIASQENFNLLFYLSERVKNYQDMIDTDEDDSEDSESDDNTHNSNNARLYIICELSQIILLQLKKKRSWQHSAYPGKLNLPSDLFKPFFSVEDAQASFKTYIKERYAELLTSNIKMKVGRIVHASQTQRQRAQKRLLDNEYNGKAIVDTSNETNKKRKVKKARKENNDDESSEEEGENNKQVYYSARRKNLRERKQVDYKENEEDEE